MALHYMEMRIPQLAPYGLAWLGLGSLGIILRVFSPAAYIYVCVCVCVCVYSLSDEIDR